MLRLRFIPLSSALVSSACTTPIPAEDLPAETARVSCALIFDCCEEGQRSGFATEAECVAMREMSAVNSPELQASIEAGRVVYDGTAAANCLASAACDISAAAEVCRDVYRPQVAPGGACESPFDCVDGFCMDNVCMAIARLGDPCTGACELGAHCSRDTSVCVASPGAGEPCPDFFCAQGAFCDFDTMMCEAQRAGGEACDSPQQCESFMCEANVCAPGGGVGDLCRP